MTVNYHHLIYWSMLLGVTCPVAGHSGGGSHLTQGIPVGGFIIQPGVTSQVTYDDNVFSDVNTNETDDVITSISPVIGVQSNWNRHSIGAVANIEQQFYASNSGENATNINLGASGRLDITDRTKLSTSLSFSNIAEARNNVLSPSNTQERTDITSISGNATLSQRFNDLTLSGGVTHTQERFEDGQTADGRTVQQRFRDFDRTIFSATASYAVSPAVSTFVQGEYNLLRFDENTPANMQAGVSESRDSDGINTQVGASFELTDLIIGRAGAGVFHQRFDNPEFDSTTGVSADVGLNWSVTPITQISVSVSNNISPQATEDAPGSVNTTGSLSVSHAIGYLTRVNTGVSFSQQDFESIDRTEETTQFSAGLQHDLTERHSVNLTYTYMDRESSGTEQLRSFDKNMLMLGISARF